MMKTYRINQFAEVEGSATAGWSVINLVTGLAHATTYPTFPEAREAAIFVGTYYRALNGR